MNKRLAAGSGVGLVVGAAIGIIFDPMLAANGTALIFGAALGIVFGAGIAAAVGQSPKNAD
jgi:F0F1-type ATP synthase assembly protein I